LNAPKNTLGMGTKDWSSKIKFWWRNIFKLGSYISRCSRRINFRSFTFFSFSKWFII